MYNLFCTAFSCTTLLYNIFLYNLFPYNIFLSKFTRKYLEQQIQCSISTRLCRYAILFIHVFLYSLSYSNYCSEYSVQDISVQQSLHENKRWPISREALYVILSKGECVTPTACIKIMLRLYIRNRCGCVTPGGLHQRQAAS